MAFCSQCGKPVDEAGRCECGHVNKRPQPVQTERENIQQPVYQEQPQIQGGQQGNGQVLPGQMNSGGESQPQMDQASPPPQGTGQIPQEQPGRQQTSRSQAPKMPAGLNVMNNCLDIIKGFFSSKPTQMLDVSIKTKNPVYAVLGALFIILNGLFVLAVFRNTLASTLGVLYYQLGSYVAIPYTELFIIGVLYAVLSFFVYCGLFKGIHSIMKQQVPFTRIMNMTAAALVPTVIACAVSSIFSFVGLPGLIFAVLLVITAQFMTAVLYYIGLQKEARFEKSPLWVFAGAYMIHQFISWLFVYIVASSILSAFVSGLMSDVFSNWSSFF